MRIIVAAQSCRYLGLRCSIPANEWSHYAE